MDINAKMLALAILASVSVGATLVFDNVEAKEVDATNHTPIPLIQSNSQKINALLKNVSVINERLEELDNRLSNEPGTTDLKRQVSELEHSVGDAKKASFDSASSSLNNLIALTALVVTILGVVLALLAIFGFRSIKEMKLENKNDLEAQAASHRNYIAQMFNKESSSIREELSELANTVGTLDVAVRQMANKENPGLIITQSNQPKSKENAFDEN
jgi:hypothetical protein